MADTRLRALERAAAQGDEAAQVALLSERIRVGFERERVVLAAHLGHTAAKLSVGNVPPLMVECAPCLRCNMSGKRRVGSGDLIQIACYHPIPHGILARWALACVRAAVEDTKYSDEQFDQLLADIQTWVDSGLLCVEPRLSSFITRRRHTIQRFGEPLEPMLEAGFLLARAATGGRDDRPGVLANVLANAVSHAYHACRSTRIARNKQVALLIATVLGDHPWQ